MKKSILLSFLAILLVAFFSFSTETARAETYPDVPKIISRAEWGADENLAKNLGKEWLPEYAKPEKFVIHHTASTNLEPDKDGS